MKKIFLLFIVFFLSSCSFDFSFLNQEFNNTEEEKYNITIATGILNGTVTTDKISASFNEVVEVFVVPNEGYELSDLYINELKIEGFKFNMPNKDVLVNATFKAIEKDEICEHNFVDYKCTNCGLEIERTYLNELFGDNIDIYTNNEENPYNIDLNKYGSDVNVYFYEPNLSIMTDPYISVNKETFYSNYERSTSYEDAYYRTKHNLMSGDITDQYYLPADDKIIIDDKAVRISTATYVLDIKGNYLAYIPNVFNDEDRNIIFYGAAYTSLNDVAAYLLAFGEAPINQIKNKNNKGISEALSSWGKYGRVNNNSFSGDISKYPYEPELPNILGTNKVYYNEIDFGTTGNYTLSNRNKTYNQVAYNNGYSITRGAVRIVYVSDKTVKSIDKRYVFYTYNHYNDFQEYLNYDNGWGYRFGNESAGNEYCYNTNDYNNFGCSAPSKYPTTLLKKYSELI